MGLKLILLFMGLIFIANVDWSCGIRWLSLQHSRLKWEQGYVRGRGTRSGNPSSCVLAARKFGLERVQARLCRKTVEVMPHVQQAAMLAVETCQKVFEYRRWNCSSTERAPHLTPDLLRATREQAYVYAISSAALAYTLARACSGGALHHCTCSSPPGEPPAANFKWGGCGDNLKYAKNFAKRFLDNAEKRHLVTKVSRREDGGGVARHKNRVVGVNLHNNRVGRKVITKSLATQCKCHGVSGSCSIKTCWRSLPPLIEIGSMLLQRYTNAKDISSGAKTKKYQKAEDEQLVFLAKSPDYCTRDDSLGSFGTTGRKCNVTSNNTDSCRQLCCGRGYRTVVEEKIERCQCKYYYCCYVKCKVCRSLTQRHECA